jgi:hypothetical protein
VPPLELGPYTLIDWPAHLRNKPDVRAALRKEADELRDVYGVPVWLVGSALIDSNEWPRDWDIRITLEPVRMVQLYSVAEMRSRWLADRHRQSDWLSRRLWLNVDFQTYPATHLDRFTGKPRFRLDTSSIWPQNGDSLNFTLV